MNDKVPKRPALHCALSLVNLPVSISQRLVDRPRIPVMTRNYSQFRLRYAADVLYSGGVVSHPTEAVWGLAALPSNPVAVRKILQMKKRDPAKGLVLVADSVQRVAELLAHLPEDRREIVVASWPGPVTWVIPDQGLLPVWVRGSFESVAIRVSDHPLTSALCHAVDSWLISTSANPAALPPARNQRQVQRYFGTQLDYILPGATGERSQPSEIRDALNGEILRPG
jgi:L-threonylcarbamoyladenylate synthase